MRKALLFIAGLVSCITASAIEIPSSVTVTKMDGGIQVDAPGHPRFFIIGGSQGRAYQLAVVQYRNTNGAPIGIAYDPRGDEDSDRMLEAWIDYTMYGNKRYENLFRYCITGEEFDGWDIHTKNMGNEPMEIRLYGDRFGQGSSTEKNDYNIYGEVQMYNGITDPSMMVYLPDPEIATGTAIIICPGGALVTLAWESEFIPVMKNLVARGIAVIGLKYRLREPVETQWTMTPDPATGNVTLPMRGRKITDYDPAVKPPHDGRDMSERTDMLNGMEDLYKAMEITKANASQWNIDPKKIGYMGFSAGGFVAVGATIQANAEQMPAFLCSIYGPSPVKVELPENAPKLFVAVHADHPNAAQDCLSLFMEWKRAGIDSEMHIYSRNTGGLFGVNPVGSDDSNTVYGFWVESLYSWLVANGFTTYVNYVH